MMNQSLRQTILLSACLGTWLSPVSVVNQSSARGLPLATNPSNSRIHYELKEPPPTGNPPQTSGAGSRGGGGNCPAVETPLTALVPKTETSKGNFVWGRTIAARPTVWVYVPYALTPTLPGELRLEEKDAQGSRVHTTIARITGTSPGVIGIRLPAGKTLETNQIYTWSFVVLCDSKDASANQFVKAVIQRIASASALANRVNQAKPWERGVLYARAGLWYDALTQLAGLRQSHPQEVAFFQDWNTLLGKGGLNHIASKAIVQAPRTAQ